MMNFIQFDENNEDHIMYARHNQDVIFEDDDGILRFGYLYEDYLGNGKNLYKLKCNGDTICNASYTFFALVHIERIKH